VDHLPTDDVRNTDQHWSVGVLEQPSKFLSLKEPEGEIDLLSEGPIGIDEKIRRVHNKPDPQSLGRNHLTIVVVKLKTEAAHCLSQDPGLSDRWIDGDEQTAAGGLSGILIDSNTGAADCASCQLSQRRSHV
jgi:hypothetical protein